MKLTASPAADFVLALSLGPAAEKALAQARCQRTRR